MENLLALVTLLFVGCGGDPNCDVQRNEQALRESTRRVSPFTLEVAGERRGDETVITVTVGLTARVAVDPVLEVRLPAGATLVTGKQKETLVRRDMSKPVVRTFVVRGATGPVDVSVTSASRSGGASLTKAWPARAPEKTRLPDVKRIPPVKVHGVPVDEVIPIKSNSK